MRPIILSFICCGLYLALIVMLWACPITYLWVHILLTVLYSSLVIIFYYFGCESILKYGMAQAKTAAAVAITTYKDIVNRNENN